MTQTVNPNHDPSALLAALIAESQKLRADVVQREDRRRTEADARDRRQRKLIAFICAGIVVAIVLIIGVVVLLVQSRARGADTRALLRANAAINQRIADCTTVTGACYQEGAQRSSVAVQQLLRAQEGIALCRAKTEPGSVTELQQCIDAELEPFLTPQPTSSKGK
jgi:hypothetical protein